MFDLHRATSTRVRRFRHVLVDTWFLAHRDPAAGPWFSTRTHESFYRDELTAKIALRAHQHLDIAALRTTTNFKVEGHITFLLGLYSLSLLLVVTMLRSGSEYSTLQFGLTLTTSE